MQVREAIDTVSYTHLKSVSNAPCFKGNVIVYSNDDILGNMIFSSVCGECIEKGNWENIVLKMCIRDRLCADWGQLSTPYPDEKRRRTP